MAVYLNPERTAGTLLGHLPLSCRSLIGSLTVDQRGNWTASVRVVRASSGPTASTSQATGVNANAGNSVHIASGTSGLGTFDGVLAAERIRFTAAVKAAEGSTRSWAGCYRAWLHNQSSGQVHVIAAATGELYALLEWGADSTGTFVALNPNGRFEAPLSGGVSLTGEFDGATHTVRGAISGAGADLPRISFAGLDQLTPRADRMVNLATRNALGTGARTMILGFVLTGSQPSTVLIRGAGPALRPFGLTQAAANPRVVLYRDGRAILDNDDWEDSPNPSALSQAFLRTGAFPFAAGSRDAALLTTLAPGSYTVMVTDPTGSGVGLAEVYDAGDSADSFSRLANISTRGTVDHGEHVLIGSFVVAGNRPKRVLVRGAGPSLASFGVQGAVTDPQLQLYSGSTPVAENDDWETPSALTRSQRVATGTEIVAAAGEVGAFAFPAGGRDAAILITLAPGAYTAHLSPGRGAPGVGLIEVYQLGDP